MYNNSHFRVGDRRKLADFIRKYSFGTVFSSSGGQLKASSFPIMVDDSCAVLTGHMSGSNQLLSGSGEERVLVVFNGPDHYISPAWYGEEYAVPTWNYIQVQVSGTMSLIRDRTGIEEILDALTDQQERKVNGNWKTDWSSNVYAGMIDEIVGFRIAIEKIEGKWKLSQNHPGENLSGVIYNLRRLSSTDAQEIADETEQFMA